MRPDACKYRQFSGENGRVLAITRDRQLEAFRGAVRAPRFFAGFYNLKYCAVTRLDVCMTDRMTDGSL